MEEQFILDEQLVFKESLLKEIDERFYEMGKKVAAYDALYDQINALNDRLSAIQESINASVSENKKNSESIRGDVQSVVRDVKSFHDRIQPIQHDLSKIIFNAADKGDLENLYAAHETQNAKIQIVPQHSDQIRSIAIDLDKMKADLESHKGKVSELHAKHSQLEVGSSSNIMQLVEAVAQLKNESDAHQDSNKKYIEFIDKFPDILTQFSSYIGNMTATEIKRLEKEIESKFASIPAPSLDDLAHKSDLEALLVRVDSLIYDSKNALLKAQHVDVQTQLHSKKIENLQLLLKKHELLT